MVNSSLIGLQVCGQNQARGASRPPHASKDLQILPRLHPVPPGESLTGGDARHVVPIGSTAGGNLIPQTAVTPHSRWPGFRRSDLLRLPRQGPRVTEETRF